MSDTTPRAINIRSAFERIKEQWSPHVAANVNGQDVRLAKIEGTFEWHSHDGIEEAFFIIKGSLSMHFRYGDKEWCERMKEGDLLVVPAGVEHLPEAQDECWIMLIENAETVNTGDNISERTRHDLPRL